MIYVFEILKGKERENGEEIFEVTMPIDFTKIMTDMKPQTQEVQRTPSKINTTESRHIICKLK